MAETIHINKKRNKELERIQVDINKTISGYKLWGQTLSKNTTGDLNDVKDINMSGDINGANSLTANNIIVAPNNIISSSINLQDRSGYDLVQELQFTSTHWVGDGTALIYNDQLQNISLSAGQYFIALQHTILYAMHDSTVVHTFDKTDYPVCNIIGTYTFVDTITSNSYNCSFNIYDHGIASIDLPINGTYNISISLRCYMRINGRVLSQAAHAQYGAPKSIIIKTKNRNNIYGQNGISIDNSLGTNNITDYQITIDYSQCRETIGKNSIYSVRSSFMTNDLASVSTDLTLYNTNSYLVDFNTDLYSLCGHPNTTGGIGLFVSPYMLREAANIIISGYTGAYQAPVDYNYNSHNGLFIPNLNNYSCSQPCHIVNTLQNNPSQIVIEVVDPYPFSIIPGQIRRLDGTIVDQIVLGTGSDIWLYPINNKIWQANI